MSEAKKNPVKTATKKKSKLPYWWEMALGASAVLLLAFFVFVTLINPVAIGFVAAGIALATSFIFAAIILERFTSKKPKAEKLALSPTGGEVILLLTSAIFLALTAFTIPSLFALFLLAASLGIFVTTVLHGYDRSEKAEKENTILKNSTQNNSPNQRTCTAPSQPSSTPFSSLYNTDPFAKEKDTSKLHTYTYGELHQFLKENSYNQVSNIIKRYGIHKNNTQKASLSDFLCYLLGIGPDRNITIVDPDDVAKFLEGLQKEISSLEEVKKSGKLQCGYTLLEIEKELVTFEKSIPPDSYPEIRTQIKKIKASIELLQKKIVESEEASLGASEVTTNTDSHGGAPP